MLPELGQLALILALLVATLQAMLPLLGAQRGIAPLMALARPAAFLQLALVALAFAILTRLAQLHHHRRAAQRATIDIDGRRLRTRCH